MSSWFVVIARGSSWLVMFVVTFVVVIVVVFMDPGAFLIISLTDEIFFSSFPQTSPLTHVSLLTVALGTSTARARWDSPLSHVVWVDHGFKFQRGVESLEVLEVRHSRSDWAIFLLTMTGLFYS